MCSGQARGDFCLDTLNLMLPKGIESREAYPMEIIVYSAPWCGDCREAKRFLDQHKLAYKDINIETTPGAADEVVKRTGKRAIPQFVIDGEWIQPYRPGEGFLYEDMAKRLGVEE
jgi:mycoredoxin